MAIYTGKDVVRDRELSCDVCIVGSGAGGAPLAAQLSEAGKRVVVLEEGGFHTSASFDMKEGTMVPRLYQEAGGRRTADASILVMQGRAVGGTTVVNWTTCYRTPETVMAHWAEHHGVEGLTHEALVPHWAWMEERLHVEAVELAQVNANNRVVWEGAEALGWRKHLLHRNVKNCAQTGYCGMGCVIDAKQSMLVTLIPDAVRAGADVYANAWVERVETDKRRAQRVIARLLDPASERPTGRTLTVRARAVVLAAGGINTPALLLRSDLNPSGRVGHRTFLHPTPAVVGIHPKTIAGFNGAPQSVACDQFSNRTEGMGFLIEASPVFPMSLGSGGPFFGAELQALAEQLPHCSVSISLLQDGFDLHDFDEGGTVTLHEDGSPKLEYKWTERFMEGLRFATQRLAEIQLAGGAKEVISLHARTLRLHGPKDLEKLAGASYGPNQAPVFSAHVMGGCAMGKDPARSVVDSRTLRLHGFDNLFVVDGSVYPTSLTVNPQLSIYGLSRWSVQHVMQAI